MIGTGALASHLIEAHASVRPDPQRAGLGPRPRQGGAARPAPDAAPSQRRGDRRSAARGERRAYHLLRDAGARADPARAIGCRWACMSISSAASRRRCARPMTTRCGAPASSSIRARRRWPQAGDIVGPIAAGAMSDDDIAGDLFELTRGEPRRPALPRPDHACSNRWAPRSRISRRRSSRSITSSLEACMSVAVKICGLSTQQALAAALAGGARFVGFVFYPPSPRASHHRASRRACPERTVRRHQGRRVGRSRR